MDNGKIKKIYKALSATFGPQHWWPGDTPFEIAVGAILTQNTNWGNVEKAIGNLKAKGALDADALQGMPVEKIAALIRPSGYYNVKARRLKEFVSFLAGSYGGRMENMRSARTGKLRERLLGVKGIGPETADSILLYALGRPVFVIDAYTKRVLARHGTLSEDGSYDAFQGLFHSLLPGDARLFNEYHALFVRLGKTFCRPKNPLCGTCPLDGFSQ